MSIRVVLAEDDYLVREGVARLIATEDDLELVATCADYASLLESVDSEHPDVLVTDIRMPPTGTDEGIRAANELHTRSPDVGVVVLSQYAEPSYALAFLENGSRGRAYLLKERVSDIKQLADAIRQTAQGGSVIDPIVVDALVAASIAGAEFAVAPAHPARDRDPRRDGDRQEQRRRRRGARAVGAGGGKAHQLDLLQARALPRARRPSPGEGRPALFVRPAEQGRGGATPRALVLATSDLPAQFAKMVP